MTPLGPRARREWFILVLAVVCLGLIPVLFQTTPERTIVFRFMIFALLGVFWNLSSGIGGQFSFGHAAYFGIGAYTTAYAVVDLGLSPWLGMALGALVAAFAGALIGWLTFRYRLRDAYFALATFAFAELLRLVVIRFEPLRAGVGYRMPLAQDSGWSVLQFAPGDSEYLILSGAMLIAALALTIGILQSRFGFLLVAVREDEDAAAAIGANPTVYKIGALTVSAAGTAIVGSLYLFYNLFVDPDIAFGPAISIQAIMAAIVGGVATIWGPVVGAGILVLVSEVATSLTRSPPELLSILSGRSGLDLIIYGIVLAAILLIVPQGLYGSAAARWRR